MIKRVNFTGRRRIPRERVDLEVFDGEPRTFDGHINVTGMEFPIDATVVVEATCAGSTEVKRYECGTVDDVLLPESRSLEGLAGENVIFCVKVIDRQEQVGRILGVCENVRPTRTGRQTASGRQGILPVERAPLGPELWRLEFKDHDVFLLVNQDITELWERARYDALFYAVVYPEVIRRILDRAIEENVDIEENDDRWPILWLRFGKGLHSAHADPPNLDDSREERDEWIDDVVSAFCRVHELKVRYQSARPTDWST
ncbi:MAG: hypothetical protein MI725_17560 [Pirellulales bacterium]|nr:hypothetical protein [Pirellulales bacterium]